MKRRDPRAPVNKEAQHRLRSAAFRGRPFWSRSERWRVLSLALLAFLSASASAQGPSAEPERVSVRDFKEIYAATEVTRAVDRGLNYLAQSQLADGSWLSPMGKNTGVVSLATLALLAAGEEPGRGKFGGAVNRAIAFLLRHQKDGLLVTADTSHGPMYEHGITTLLLGEVLGMVNSRRPGFERIWRAHRTATNLILRAQGVPRDPTNTGGWRYNPTSTDADLSVTGWEILALRSAQSAGLEVPKRSIGEAVLYVKRCSDKATGGFGYMPGSNPNVARTGTGILALELCGDFQSPEALRGGAWLIKNPPEWKGPFFYYALYYSTQATYQLGGPYWEAWRPLSEGVLLEHQDPNGSWPPPPNETHERQAGLPYTTAMAILSLTVDYRYLPIYQR